jgi:DNA-directed RNA polymerase subunit beta'
MVLGSYYLTLVKPGMEPGEGKAFRDINEAVMAYSEGVVGLHAPIFCAVEKEVDGVCSRSHQHHRRQTIFNMPIRRSRLCRPQQP